MRREEEERRSRRGGSGSDTAKRSGMRTPVRAGKEIVVESLNMNNKGVMGLTPTHKLRKLREFISKLPDVILIQDSIEHDDLADLLNDVSREKYDSYFQAIGEIEVAGEENNEQIRSITGIVWNRENYVGTPLNLDDDRLAEFSDWIAGRDMTVVKLDPVDHAPEVTFTYFTVYTVTLF